MSTEILEKEENKTDVPDEQKYLFQVAIMKKMLGDNPSVEEEVTFAEKYGLVLSKIINNNQHIRDLIAKDVNDEVAVNEVVEILKYK
jgi:hypothetical protein